MRVHERITPCEIKGLHVQNMELVGCWDILICCAMLCLAPFTSSRLGTLLNKGTAPTHFNLKLETYYHMNVTIKKAIKLIFLAWNSCKQILQTVLKIMIPLYRVCLLSKHLAIKPLQMKNNKDELLALQLLCTQKLYTVNMYPVKTEPVRIF